MNEIWANRLVSGTKSWAEMPVSRQNGVKQILANRVVDDVISPEQYEKITGEKYVEN